MYSTWFCGVHENFPQVGRMDDEIYLDSSSGLPDRNGYLDYITQWVVNDCIYRALQKLKA